MTWWHAEWNSASATRCLLKQATHCPNLPRQVSGGLPVVGLASRRGHAILWLLIRMSLDAICQEYGS